MAEEPVRWCRFAVPGAPPLLDFISGFCLQERNEVGMVSWSMRDFSGADDCTTRGGLFSGVLCDRIWKQEAFNGELFFALIPTAAG